MAKPRRLPSGKWQASVWVVPGRKRSTKTFLIRKQAVEWAREQQVLIDRGEWRDPRLARTLFGDWFERWWAARVLEPETVVGQRSTADRHILPHWRDWTLGSIGRLEVQAWVRGMQQAGKSAALIDKAYSIFRACLNDAVDEDLIGRSPCRSITLPTIAKGQPRFYEPAQVELLVAELPEPHATVALVMAWCGLRWEEVAGLDVAAVRVLRRELAVERVITRAQRIKAYPKSAAGHRTVPAPAHVLDRLAPFWQAAKDGAEPADGVRLLFRSPRDGRPLGYMAWWSAWRNAHARLTARKVEVPDYSPHTLRHTAASWWVQAGVPIFEVKELLGHSKIDSTMVYAHLAPGVHRSVREAWAALLEDRARSMRADLGV